MSNVYVIGNARDRKIKIGVADDPHKRIIDLQVGSPFPLSMYCVINCKDSDTAYKLEALLHSRYEKFRTHGEWHDISYGVMMKDIEDMLSIAECITGIKVMAVRVSNKEAKTNHKVIREVAMERQVVKARFSGRVPRQKDARALVYSYLDANPTDVDLSSRTLAERIGVGHESANRYRNEWSESESQNIEI